MAPHTIASRRPMLQDGDAPPETHLMRDRADDAAVDDIIVCTISYRKLHCRHQPRLVRDWGICLLALGLRQRLQRCVRCRRLWQMLRKLVQCLLRSHRPCQKSMTWLLGEIPNHAIEKLAHLCLHQLCTQRVDIALQISVAALQIGIAALQIGIAALQIGAAALRRTAHRAL